MQPNGSSDKNKGKKSAVADDFGGQPGELADKGVIPTEAPSVSDISSRVDLNTLATNAIGSVQNQALLDIRHKALEKLSNLVDNLEHPPEQHFQTLMMIIQETDNMGMIDKAYATALQLKDAKERAQALLAIANEINYFTSK